MKKIFIDNKSINYLIVNELGKVIETGEDAAINDTFEDTLVDMNKLEVGVPLNVSFNAGLYERRNSSLEGVWVDLLYDVLSIEDVQIKEEAL